MPGQQHQQQQQLRRGEPARPLPTPDRSSSQSIPALSIETPDPSIRPASAISQTPQSPAHTPVFRIPQSPRVVPGGDSSQTVGKVAIPRLKRPIDAAGEDASRSAGRHRVNHACEPCRHRKTKCSGERPVCRHCQDFKIACFYADGKRDRVKKYARFLCARQDRSG